MFFFVYFFLYFFGVEFYDFFVYIFLLPPPGNGGRGKICVVQGFFVTEGTKFALVTIVTIYAPFHSVYCDTFCYTMASLF